MRAPLFISSLFEMHAAVHVAVARSTVRELLMLLQCKLRRSFTLPLQMHAAVVAVARSRCRLAAVHKQQLLLRCELKRNRGYAVGRPRPVARIDGGGRAGARIHDEG